MRSIGANTNYFAIAVAFATLVSPVAAEQAANRNAVTVFGAQLTDNKWREIAALEDVSMRDAYLLGVGLSREIAGGDQWALEIEGQAARHFGSQHLWEFNGVLKGRWRSFPWNESLPTSAPLGPALPSRPKSRLGRSP